MLSVAREGTGQRVAGTRQMEKGSRVRVMEEEARVIIGDPMVLTVDVIYNQGANKLISWTTTVKRNQLPSQLTTMGKGPVKTTLLQ